MSSVLKRREIVVAIMLITTLILSVEYYVSSDVFPSKPSLELQRWGVIMATFALGFGVVNALRYHTGRIRKQESPDMYWSILLLVVMFVTMAIGLGTGGTSHPAYRWLFNNFLTAGEATSATLVSFSVVSAVYRTLRIRRWDVVVIFISIIFYMVYLTTIGDLLLPGIMKEFGDFLGANIYMFGTGFAYTFFSLALSLRVITGRERAFEV
jgi:uncharacterized membrane protein